MELLCDDDDLVWSLTGSGTHEHVLGMMLKSFEPWRCPYVEPLMYGDEDIEEVCGTYDGHLSHKCVVVKFLNNDVVDLLMKTWWRTPDEDLDSLTKVMKSIACMMSWWRHPHTCDDTLTYIWWGSWNAFGLRTHTHDDGILDDDVVDTHTWHTYIDFKVKYTLHTLD